jgi:hypothetical protein
MTKTPTTPPATVAIEPPDNIEELVQQFVKLRDRLKEADDAHKEKTKPAREYLDRLSGRLLDRLNEIGGENVKTKAGTVYRTTRRSATIADGEAFRSFVIDNAAYDIVDWRANANAVDDFIKSEGSAPPGINFSTAFTVGVRRS